MKKLLYLLTVLLAMPMGLKAGSVTLEDFSSTVFYPVSTQLTTGIIATIWGLYDSGTKVFTPLISATPSASNSGFLDLPNTELFLNLVQGDNINVAVGSLLYAAIYNLPEGSTYNMTIAQAILTDPSWVAPTFTFSTPTLTFNLTANTTTVLTNGAGQGLYNYNGGSPEVTLAIPEPTTMALLAGSLTAIMVLRRRRRIS